MTHGLHVPIPLFRRYRATVVSFFLRMYRTRHTILDTPGSSRLGDGARFGVVAASQLSAVPDVQTRGGEAGGTTRGVISPSSNRPGVRQMEECFAHASSHPSQ